jgi:hypothetical protein
MANYRPNCFVIDLNNVTKRMDSKTVHHFVLEKLKVPPDEVVAFQINYQKKLVFIEVQTNEKAISIVTENHLKQTINFENVDFTVSLFMVDGGVDIKLHDLPPRMDLFLIHDKMREYGEILKITEEKWGAGFPFENVSNGVRIVRMKLTQNIPSYITIAGETTYVTYKNQIITCKWCGQRLHYGKSCAENRISQTGSANERLRSFADALQQNSNKPDTVNNNNKTTNSTINNSTVNSNNSNNNDQQITQIVQIHKTVTETSPQIASNSQAAVLPHQAKPAFDVSDIVKGIFWKNKTTENTTTTSQTDQSDNSDEEMNTEADEPEATNTQPGTTGSTKPETTGNTQYRKTPDTNSQNDKSPMKTRSSSTSLASRHKKAKRNQR